MLAIKNQIMEIWNISVRSISRLDTAKEIISELEDLSVWDYKPKKQREKKTEL